MSYTYENVFQEQQPDSSDSDFNEDDYDMDYVGDGGQEQSDDEEEVMGDDEEEEVEVVPPEETEDMEEDEDDNANLEMRGRKIKPLSAI